MIHLLEELHMDFFKSVYLLYFTMLSLIIIGVLNIQDSWMSLQNLYASNAHNDTAANEVLYKPALDIIHYRDKVFMLHTQLIICLLIIGIIYCVVQIFSNTISKKKTQPSFSKYIIACAFIFIPANAHVIASYLTFISFNEDIIMFLPFMLLVIILFIGTKQPRKRMN